MAGWNEPEHRLDSERLKEMFVSLDSQIGLRRDTAAAGKLDVLACGGAVMCFKIADRGTGDVDIMWPSLPPDVQHAARVVARRRGVDPNWFNDGPARVSPYGPSAISEILYDGEHLRVYAPDNDFLLGMKAHAARAEDRADAL